MFLLRRAALRAVSASPSASFVVKPRAFTTIASPTFKARPQSIVSPFQRRFNSDEVKPSEETASEEAKPSETVTESPSETEAQDEHASSSTVGEAVDAAADTVKEGINSAADTFGAGQPFPTEPKANVVYVGNIFFEVTQDQLRKEFSTVGNVLSVKIVNDARGLSKGFGYVEFEDADQANEAVEKLNQRVFEGRRMAVQFHRPRASAERPSRERKFDRNPPSKTLFIGNMSFEMSDKDLNDLFREIRNVTDVRVAIDRRTGQPRGFAHADFIDVASAEKAKDKLEGKEIYGRNLRVDFSLSNDDKQRSSRR